MAWVKMTAAHVKRVNRTVSKGFKANCRYSVPRTWADEFVAIGVATLIETPGRADAPTKPVRRRRK